MFEEAGADEGGVDESGVAESGVAERVRRAAVDLFAEHGYAGTSVAQIVERAGVTKGAMYHYFRSKDDLLFGIYEDVLAVQSEHLHAIVGRGMDASATLRAVCEDVVLTSIASLREGAVFFSSAQQLSPPRRAEVTRARRAYHDAFADLLRRGQEEGRWRRDVPVAVLVASFFAGVHYLPTWYRPDGPLRPQVLAGQMADLFLASLAVPSP